MIEYMPEGLGKRAQSLTSDELISAANHETILESTALAFDKQRSLRFEIGGKIFYMPYEECALNAGCTGFRDVALLTRVGRPTCFAIYNNGDESELHISRKRAQLQCMTNFLDALQPGDILPCVVTRLEPFGAFCDVGCGISALLPIDCLSVSRIQSPSDRLKVGQQIHCALKFRDEQGRLVLSMKELMGTWEENAQNFSAGETVVGIVRSIESYGVFVELAPNLAGLAESDEMLVPGQPVSVYIKSILPDKMKIKLSIVNSQLDEPVFFPPRYFLRSGHLDFWKYSPNGCSKQITTYFQSSSLPL